MPLAQNVARSSVRSMRCLSSSALKPWRPVHSPSVAPSRRRIGPPSVCSMCSTGKLSAAALNTPVLHVDDVDHDALVLKLGAWQAAWLLKDAAGPEELRALIDRPELRATFCARSALKVLDP